MPFLLSTKECSKVEIGLFLGPALSYQAYWSSQWLQIFCKYCKYMYKLPYIFALWFFWNYTQSIEKCISAHRNFQNFPGDHAPGPPPRGGEGKPSPWSLRDHNFWGSQSSTSPRDSNPGSATENFTVFTEIWWKLYRVKFYIKTDSRPCIRTSNRYNLAMPWPILILQATTGYKLECTTTR